MRLNAGLDLENVLKDPFQRAFQLFGDWKSDRDTTERVMQESATLVRAGLSVQLSHVKLYQRIYQRSLQFGIVGSLTLESVNEC